MLKRIEIVGFKSFADKVVLEFPLGLVGVVGPNGSGKSNIIDAFRWLLGEREAQNLRGAKVEDLIFAGTPARSRVGLAQASLVLDNEKGNWPIEFSEIVIKRQISRDGESKYFLNQDEVRLKDLIDFFSKSRLGARGLTLVSQGESDVFIKSTPADRKLMIEEVLGLKEYRLKKNESERRLDTTRINLEKVRAQLEEMLPALKLLKRQTNKWSKREELKKELSELEDIFFGSQLLQIKNGLSSAMGDMKILDGEIVKQKEILRVLENELREIEKSEPNSREELKKIRIKQNELLPRKSQIERELGRLEALSSNISEEKLDLPKSADLFKLIEEIRNFLSLIQKETDLSKIHEIVSRSIYKIENVFAKSTTKKTDVNVVVLKKEFETNFSSINNELEKLVRKEAEISKLLEGFNKSFRKSLEDLERERTKHASLEQKYNRFALDKERFCFKQSELENQLQRIGRTISDIKIPETTSRESELGEMEKRILKIQNELASIGEIDNALLKETEETENRYNFLSGQSTDLEIASKDLGTLIKELDNKIHKEFKDALLNINLEFNKFFGMLFGGGKAKLVPVVQQRTEELKNGETEEQRNNETNRQLAGIDIEINLPKKKVKGLEALSGGEKSLVSLAALFALVSVSPPPFLILDEIDAALDEKNARRFSTILRDLSRKTQFIVVTHNRATMEAADVLYGVTMDRDGASRVLSLKLS